MNENLLTIEKRSSINGTFWKKRLINDSLDTDKITDSKLNNILVEFNKNWGGAATLNASPSNFDIVFHHTILIAKKLDYMLDLKHTNLDRFYHPAGHEKLPSSSSPPVATPTRMRWLQDQT